MTSGIKKIVAIVCAVAAMAVTGWLGMRQGYNDVVDVTQRVMNQYGPALRGNMYLEIAQTAKTHPNLFADFTPEEFAAIGRFGQATRAGFQPSAKDAEICTAAYNKFKSSTTENIKSMYQIDEAEKVQHETYATIISNIKQKLGLSRVSQ